jgi:hypothetical protein
MRFKYAVLSTVTSPQTRQSVNCELITSKGKEFSILYCIWTDTDAYSLCYPVGNGDIFPWVKAYFCLFAMKSNLDLGQISYKDINWIELAEDHI